MKLKYHVLILLLIVASSAQGFEEIGPVSEPLEPMQKWRLREVGSKWVYHDNLKNREAFIEITSRSEEGDNYHDSPSGCQFTREFAFAPEAKWQNCSGTTGKQNVKLIGNIWPLKRDTKFRFKVKGRNSIGRTWNVSVKCEVEDEVRIKTVSGEFDTYKLVCRDGWSTRIRYVSPAEESIVMYQNKRKTRGLVHSNEWIRWE